MTLRNSDTLQDLLDRLGGVPASRVLMRPAPGRATVADVIRNIDGGDKRLVELVDGTLVEKSRGTWKSYLAALIGARISSHAEGLGMLLGANGALEIAPGLVRIPDVSFTFWDKLPKRKVPTVSIPRLVPDLAIEVYSPGNRRGEMRRKLGEYLGAGITEVWMVYPKSRTIRVYRAGAESVHYAVGDTLVSTVLPGFQIELAKVFAKLEDAPAAPPKKRKKK